jgi:hypothetical protein
LIKSEYFKKSGGKDNEGMMVRRYNGIMVTCYGGPKDKKGRMGEKGKGRKRRGEWVKRGRGEKEGENG